MARPQRRRRPGGGFARVPRPEWLSWLEEQEQKPGVFVPPNNPVVEEFDPLLTRARTVEEKKIGATGSDGGTRARGGTE